MLEFSEEIETMVLVCDTCDEADEFQGNYKECRARAKKVGWKVFQDGDEWRHICNKCSHTYNKNL